MRGSNPRRNDNVTQVSMDETPKPCIGSGDVGFNSQVLQFFQMLMLTVQASEKTYQIMERQAQSNETIRRLLVG